MKKKVLSILVIAVMMLSFVFQAPGLAVNDYSYIRVVLVSMGSPSSVTFIVKGAYRIAEAPDVDLYPGITYTIKPYGTSAQQLAWSDGTGTTQTVNLPASVSLKQYDNGSAANYLYINNTAYGWRYYKGDMLFKRSGAASLQLINKVFFETYLYGVVAYEMSNGFPLEALKVQAICARTYSLRYMKANYNNVYQIGDTSANQVYKGYPPGCNNVIAAVDATHGQIVNWGDPSVINPVDGVFSASNGGDVRTTRMHWGGTNTYHVFKEDPYDARNPSSPSYTFIFPTSYDTATLGLLSTTNRAKVDAMGAIMMPKILAALKAQYGYTCTEADVKITGVLSAVPAVPMPGLPAGNHEFTEVDVTVRITANVAIPRPGIAHTPTGGPLNMRSSMSTASSANIIGTIPNGATLTVLDTHAGTSWYKVTYGGKTGYSWAAYITLQPIPTPTPSATPTASPSPEPTASVPADGTISPDTEPDATPIDEQSGGGASPYAETATFDVAIKLAYFTKDANGNYTVHGELKTVFGGDKTKPYYSSLIDTSSMWNLYPQASTDGKFLYVVARGYGHGVGMSQRGAQQMANEGQGYMQILDFYYNFTTTSARMGNVAAVEVPLAPIPGAGAAAQMATVKGSGVLVRANHSATATSVYTLAQGARVEVLGTSGDWYRVLDAAHGIVGWACWRSGSTTYIEADAPPPTPTPTESETPAATITESAAPTASPTESPTSATAVTELPSTATASPSPTPSPTPSPSPTLSPKPSPSPTPTPQPGIGRPIIGRANVAYYLSLRASASTSASRLAKVPPNGAMTVLMVYPSSTWLKVTYSGKTGYVLSHYVIIEGNRAYKAGTVTSTALNVRSSMSSSSSANLLGTLNRNATVVIVSTVKYGGYTWYKILYGGGYAYVDSRYMRKQGS